MGLTLCAYSLYLIPYHQYQLVLSTWLHLYICQNQVSHPEKSWSCSNSFAFDMLKAMPEIMDYKIESCTCLWEENNPKLYNLVQPTQVRRFLRIFLKFIVTVFRQLLTEGVKPYKAVLAGWLFDHCCGMDSLLHGLVLALHNLGRVSTVFCSDWRWGTLSITASLF